jgi:hypothetical protein
LLYFPCAFSQDIVQPLISDKGDQKIIELIQLERNEFCLIYSEKNFSESILKFQIFNRTTSSVNFGASGQVTPNIFSKQESPNITVIGSQLIFICWIDYRNDSEGDVYGQLIDRNGIIWSNGGSPISTVKGKQSEVTVSSDKFGNLFAAWRDFRSDISGNIFAQKLNLYGETLWKKDGIPIIQLIGEQCKPKVISDETAGAFVGWLDKSNNIAQLYIQRLDLNGNKSFGEYGKFISDPSFKTEEHKIFFDSKAGLTIFYTGLSNSKKLLVQRLKLNGIREFSGFGNELLSSYDNQELSDVLQFGDKFLLVFTNEQNGLRTVKTQFLSTKGFINASRSQNLHEYCRLHSKPTAVQLNNDFLIYWLCSHTSKKNIELFGQVISETGQIQLKKNGVKLSELSFEAEDQVLLAVNSFRNITAFIDKNINSERDIYFFEVSRPFEKNLAVEDFRVSYYEGLAKITWISLNEKNGVSYSLERRSETESWEEIYAVEIKDKSDRKFHSFDDNLIHEGRYQYRIKYTDPEKNIMYSQIENLQVNVEDEGFFLFQNTPNPFNNSTKITYKISQPEKVKITIYNSRAEEMLTLTDSEQESGTHEIIFDPSNDLSSGVYFYKIQAGKFFDVKKMIYTK